MSERPAELYGIPISELARICQVSVKTASRWKRGQTVPPKTALMILRADLGCFDPTWAGWTLSRGELISPEGWQIRLHDVLGTPLRRAQLEAYKSKVRHLEGKWDATPEQPLPGEIPQIQSA